MKTVETLLAFDFGEKKIGVAVGQTITATASPVGLVRVHESGTDWPAITRLIDTWQPDALVVGLPLNMDGTEQLMTRAARRFRNQLEGRYSLPVHTMDERLSTREARDRLASRGQLDQDDDPVAAQIILEGWLAQRVEEVRLTTDG